MSHRPPKECVLFPRYITFVSQFTIHRISNLHPPPLPTSQPPTPMFLRRCMSTAATSTTTIRNIPNVACHLPSRTLLHVHGLESTKFLQGLLTNDVESIQTPNSSMFCHLLNQKGRAMFESFVAVPDQNSELASSDTNMGSYLMECHVDVAARLCDDYAVGRRRGGHAGCHAVVWSGRAHGGGD